LFYVSLKKVIFCQMFLAYLTEIIESLLLAENLSVLPIMSVLQKRNIQMFRFAQCLILLIPYNFTLCERGRYFFLYL